MKLNNLILAAIVVILLGGGIVTTVVLDLWHAKPGGSIPIAPSADGAAGTGSVNITAKPADILGTNTFAEISQMFNIPLKELADAFGITSLPNYASLKARELKTIYTDFGTDIKMETESVRIFASMYTGKPYTYSPTAYLPRPAVEILKQKASLTPDQLAFIGSHTVDIANKLATGASAQPAPSQLVVTGETSFQKIIDYGIPASDVEKAIGDRLPPANTLIKEYAAQKNRDFLGVVSLLQEMVNKRYSPK